MTDELAIQLVLLGVFFFVGWVTAQNVQKL